MRILIPILVATLVLAACEKQTVAPAKPDAAKPAAQAPVKITGPIPAAYEEPVVGGAVMSAGKDIMSNLAASSEHTKFVAAVKAAGMLETLQGRGPFTVFAPTDAAFDQLAAPRMDQLMKPEARDDLAALLAYHIVPGKLDAQALQTLLLAGNGSAKLKTVEGTSITATVGNGQASIIDAKNNTARVSVANVVQVNGVVHVVNRVLQH